MRNRNLPAGLLLSLVAPILCLALGAVLVCPDGLCPAAEAEGRILAGFQAWRTPGLDLFFGVLTWFGSMLVLGPLCLGLAWRSMKRRQPRAALLAGLALAGAWMLARGAKLIVLRPRPELFPWLTVPPADCSFPSGHAMQVTAFALAWFFFARQGRGWTGIAGPMALVAGVALSRLYLQVHFPSDVLAGVLAAAAWVLGLRFFLASWVRQDQGPGERGRQAVV